MHRLAEQALVTAIMPNLNNGQYIRQAIESFLSQTYSKLELLIIDDGSDDDSVSIAEKFVASNDNIKLFTTPGRKGSATARNIGIRNAKGDFIAFLDSDDIWLPTKIEKQVNAYLSSSSLCVVYSDWFRIDELGNILPPGRLQKPRISGNIFASALEMVFGASTMFLIPRGIIDIVGMFDENLRWAEDLDFTLRLARRFPFMYIDEKLYGYRVHKKSKRTLISRSERLYCESKVIRRHFEEGKKALGKNSQHRIISLLTQYYLKTKQYREMFSLYVSNPDSWSMLLRPLSRMLF
jgi:glycosyltransferase involved in cell wall biosynthesis